MTDALREQNHVTTGLAYNGSTVEPIRVNPADDALLIEVYHTSDTPVDTENRFQRDDNHVSVMGAYNETTGNVEPVRCNDEGIIYAKLTS